jgi:hypothetical protein
MSSSKARVPSLGAVEVAEEVEGRAADEWAVEVEEVIVAETVACGDEEVV